jgi:hypothetical protein
VGFQYYLYVIKTFIYVKTNTSTNRLILSGEILAVCYENHMTHMNTLYGWDARLLNIKASGTYSYHCPVKV